MRLSQCGDAMGALQHASRGMHVACYACCVVRMWCDMHVAWCECGVVCMARAGTAVRVGVVVRVRGRVRGGGAFPQADPQCISTQRTHTKHMISGS